MLYRFKFTGDVLIRLKGPVPSKTIYTLIYELVSPAVLVPFVKNELYKLLSNAEGLAGLESRSHGLAIEYICEIDITLHAPSEVCEQHYPCSHIESIPICSSLLKKNYPRLGLISVFSPNSRLLVEKPQTF